MDPRDLNRCALIVIDAQQGFDDPWWGRRDNPDCDSNIAALVEHWSVQGRPLVYVQHASRTPDSPLHPASAGHQLKSYLDRHTPDLLVTKSVNSSFHGHPDLNLWLRSQSVSSIAVCGITTNHCCETTARIGGNLGYDVLFAVDATHTFDRQTPDGEWIAAEDLVRVTATNLHGEFASVVLSRQLFADGDEY